MSSPISHDDECSICIESLANPSHIQHAIAKLSPCNHCYHDLCIRSWSHQANSCPKCRVRFNTVELIDKHGKLIYQYSVEHKNFPVDPNYLAPTQETDEGPLLLQQQQPGNQRYTSSSAISSLLSFSVTCSLCCSSSDTSNVSVCENCCSCFHPQCLGMDDSYSGYWNCPMCDCLQESLLSRVNNNQNNRNNNNPRRRQRSTNRFIRRTDATYERIVRQHRSGQGSLNNNNNNNSILGSPEPVPHKNPEEEEAWTEFEKVRKRSDGAPVPINDHQASSSSSSSSSTSASLPSGSTAGSCESTRKLKRPSRRGSKLGQKVGKTSSKVIPTKVDHGQSRVMSLLSEMHSNSELLVRDSRNTRVLKTYQPQRLYGQLSPPMSPSNPDAKHDDPDCKNLDSDTTNGDSDAKSGKMKVPILQ
ncbi:hypothetical protein DASC09_029090 [Saccharomycopsis crataegensis]|uniref:RING-type domain-containing protein n=1 Tax=Saccharomycopsis crataegensis TaxID=43959 RepID=A0AAV5QLS2_9ASCO|nr:hypothetical protein DASC09_029090 [Saccharomycopsis crataegensis]